jgi:hypothetical protein
MPPKTHRKPATRRATRATFSDELRDAIERSGLTPYALGKEAAVDPGILSRFLAGRRGMTTDTVDRITATLGLHLGAPARAKGRPRRDLGPVQEVEGEPSEVSIVSETTEKTNQRM